MAISSDGTASGVSHNQFAIPAGTSAKHTINIQKFGLSMATMIPTVAAVATHAANTGSFN